MEHVREQNQLENLLINLVFTSEVERESIREDLDLRKRATLTMKYHQLKIINHESFVRRR